jgi:hypothetical protein
LSETKQPARPRLEQSPERRQRLIGGKPATQKQLDDYQRELKAMEEQELQLLRIRQEYMYPYRKR